LLRPESLRECEPAMRDGQQASCRLDAVGPVLFVDLSTVRM